MNNARNSTRLRVGRGSSTSKITAIGAAPAIRRAILNAERSGHFPHQTVHHLLNRLDQGAERPAALWALSLAVNTGHMDSMTAHRAARTLGGWL